METDFLIRKCGKQILFQLFNSDVPLSSSEIYKKIDVTYPYLSLLIKRMDETGLIERKRIGRKYNIIITDKGRRLVSHLRSIENIFKGVKKC